MQTNLFPFSIGARLQAELSCVCCRSAINRPSGQKPFPGGPDDLPNRTDFGEAAVPIQGLHDLLPHQAALWHHYLMSRLKFKG
jgi:hypothetical protein